MLNRCFPQPRLSLMLLATWLLLQNTLAPGHIVLGTVLAIALPLLTADFWPERIVVRKPMVLLVFTARVLGDIVIANLSVARLLLSPTPALRPCFIEITLSLKNEFALLILTNTISLTPGTVSAQLGDDNKTLLLHCLDLDDRTALIAQIKNRYETPLQEVFDPC